MEGKERTKVGGGPATAGAGLRPTRPLYIVDAFTSQPFAGNPAAVCLVGKDHDISEEWMQSVAIEMNLSETAFIRTLHDTDSFLESSRFGIRWFSLLGETNLCGHGTVASAATLFMCVGNTSDRLVFETQKRGELVAVRQGSGIKLEMPLQTSEPQHPEAYSEIIKHLSGADHYPVREVRLSREGQKLLVRLEDSCTRKDLESMKPNYPQVAELTDSSKFVGVTVTLRGSRENGCVDAAGEVYDFVSRHFCPWEGVPEDPVCGSAHIVLGSYWAEQLGKKILYARQVSRRGGELRLKVRDDGRIDLYGEAAVVLQGSIYV